MTGHTPRIQEITAALAAGKPVQTVRLHATFAQIGGRPVTFCTNKRRDPIQRNQRNGRFYEQRELELLAQLAPRGGVFVDIGANVGNHTLFFALFLDAARVVPVEPNPLAYELLVANVLVNGLAERVRLDCLGVGLSDSRSGGFAMEEMRRNLGAARMLEGAGELEVFRADELLAGEMPDFVKIDVEGMEIAVLNGMSGLLETCRPMFFVEVDDENADAFARWCSENDYASVFRHRRYRNNENHLLVETARAPAMKKKIQEIQMEENDA